MNKPKMAYSCNAFIREIRDRQERYLIETCLQTNRQTNKQTDITSS